MSEEIRSGRMPRQVLLRTASALNLTYRNWSRNRTIRLGAGLAYYALFGLIPLLSLCLFGATLFFDESEIESFLADQLSATTGADLDELAASIAQQASDRANQATLGIVGMLGLVIASSVVFVAVEDALGIIFGLPLRRGTESWVRRRLRGVLLVLLISTLFIGAVALQIAAGRLEGAIDANGNVIDEIAALVSLLLSAGIGTLTLALLLRLLTFSSVPWRYALTGSLVTALGLALGAWALGVYYGTIGAVSLAGAIGGLLAIVLFLYYESQILLAGAELTNVIWRRGPFGDGGTPLSADKGDRPDHPSEGEDSALDDRDDRSTSRSGESP